MMQLLRLADIRIDGGTQPRVNIDNELVKEYSEAMKNGDNFPPLGVVFDGAEYWLYDGFHRYHAAQLADITEFPTEVASGSQNSARWLSLTTNKAHGLRRSNSDKQKAVKIALEMKPEMSDRALAQHCGVSNVFVSKMRNQVLTVNSQTSSAPQKRVGLDGREYNFPPVPPAPEESPKPKRPVDKLGRYIPDECLEVWNRRSEIREHMTAISKVRTAFEKGFDSKDLLYKGVNDQTLKASLDRAFSTAKTAMPYVVCPYCHGHGSCRVCQDKGMISKFLWDTAVPQELKDDIACLIKDQD